MEQSHTLMFLMLIMHGPFGIKAQFGIPEMFISDAIVQWAANDPVFIIQGDVDFSNIMLAQNTMANFITYEDNNIEEILTYISFLDSMDSIDMIFFLGTELDELIRGLDRKIGFRHSETLFTNPSIVSFIPANHDLTQVRLQLNSRVFLYNGKQDLIEISEQYRIKGGPIIERQIGSWSLNKGILLDNPIMWLRRKDLQGQDIRVASVQYPVVSRIEYDVKGNIIGGSGFFQDILMTLAHKNALNFSRVLMPPIDGNVGALVDGKWNGMVGMLIRDQCDLVSSPLTQTMQRDAVIDFTIPLDQEIATLIAPKNQGRALDLWTYFDLFPPSLWVVFFITLALLGFCWNLIELSGITKLHGDSDSEPFSLMNGLGVVGLLWFQLDYPTLKKNKLSSKILFISSAFLYYIFFESYAGDLTAFMASGPAPVTIRNFKDATDMEYKVMVQQYSSNHEFLKTAEEGTSMHDTYWDTMDDNMDVFVKTNSEGKKRLLQGEKLLLFASWYAVIGDERFIALKTEDSILGQISWATKKNSEFTELLNWHLHRMDESGQMHKIKRDGTYNPNESFEQEPAHAFGFQLVIFPFNILFCGFVLGVGVVVLEKVKRILTRESATSQKNRLVQGF